MNGIRNFQRRPNFTARYFYKSANRGQKITQEEVLETRATLQLAKDMHNDQKIGRKGSYKLSVSKRAPLTV